MALNYFISNSETMDFKLKHRTEKLRHLLNKVSQTSKKSSYILKGDYTA
jgi:hypothetical protein